MSDVVLAILDEIGARRAPKGAHNIGARRAP